MMKKSFAIALLMGIALSASAHTSVGRLETQILRIPLRLLPGAPGQFYCDVAPTVTYLSMMSSNATVKGFSDECITFAAPDHPPSILNQVYFTADLGPFTGSGPGYIDIMYKGYRQGVACYQGKGTHNLEFSGY